MRNCRYTLLAGVIVVLLPGCRRSPQQSGDMILGNWMSQDASHTVVLTFTADNHFRRMQLMNSAQPHVTEGTWTLEGDTLRCQADAPSSKTVTSSIHLTPTALEWKEAGGIPVHFIRTTSGS